MRIAEIFRSWQGEGFLTGTPSVFVRTSGCNLRCWFCDTPYTSWDPEGEDLSLGDILGRVEDLLGEAGAESPDYTVQSLGTLSTGPSRRLTEPAEPCRHIVLTGGEPMLFAELVPLTAELRQRGLHITIETAGTLDLPVECDLMSISPKLASSTPTVERAGRWHDRHEQSRHVPGVIRRLVRDYSYQIKFVVDSEIDCEAIEAWLQEFPEIERSRVLLMPQGTELERLNRHALWLEPYCHQRGFHYCPRKHIEWFGCVRGT